MAPSIGRLNYHHLYYFWAVARSDSLTGAAKQLRVAQSALSTQIRQLEEQLGEPLFERAGRSLALTEAGRIAKRYADNIFASGDELIATFQTGRAKVDTLRIGAVATLSRNFQDSFVAPLLGDDTLRLSMRSGALEDLLARLRNHELDVVLSNRAVAPEDTVPLRCRRIARQEVSLVGRPVERPLLFPNGIDGVPMLLPSQDSDVRTAFEILCEQHGVKPQVRAEVDDMAMMRLLARDTDVVALLPSVVVRDELRSGSLQEYGVVPELYEDFYAITAARTFPHPLVEPLLARQEDEVLAMGND